MPREHYPPTEAPAPTAGWLMLARKPFDGHDMFRFSYPGGECWMRVTMVSRNYVRFAFHAPKEFEITRAETIGHE